MRFPTFRAAAAAAMALAAFAAGAADYLPGLQADTQLVNADIDRGRCAVWEDGAETGEGLPDPDQLIFRRDANPRSPYGERFGTGRSKSRIHLRYAFNRPIAAGSVLCESTASVSVLRPGAACPGDMNDESQWISGERLEVDGTTSTEAAKGYVVWTFPAGTETRAVRFSHTPDPLDADRRGWLNAFLVSPRRYLSLGRFATARSDVYARRADRLNNGRDDGLNNTWSNMDGTRKEDEMPVVDRDHPGVFTLAWPEAVTFDTLVTLHTGFGSCEVDAFAGPAGRDPAAAEEGDWRCVGAFSGLALNFPWTTPNFLKLEKPVTTRALRMRLTEKVECGHEHVRGQNRNGKRVYLGEILVLDSLGAGAHHEAPAFVARMNRRIHAPVPVRFSLPEAGRVTLVLERDGRRVCNLVADAPFPAGDNVFWWDGSNDLGRDLEAANHGLLRIPAELVAPGGYTVRGLWHKDIVPVYEFGVYAPGRWKAGDRGSNWLANHTPPQSAAFVDGARTPDGRPLLFFGASVTEGPHGLIWTDLDGHKVDGLHWVGGNWLAAPHLAADSGPDADPSRAVYVAAVFGKDGDELVSEVRLNALSAKDLRRVVEIARVEIRRDAVKREKVEDRTELLGGIAVRDARIALSLPKLGEVWLLDGGGALKRKIPGLPDTRGVAFGPDGALYALSGRRLVRVDPVASGAAPETVVGDGLEDPRGLAAGADGTLYVSDWGRSHQVKAFGRDGRPARVYGKAGEPSSGPYDRRHMNHPWGMAVDCSNRLWVAEFDYLPKRISVWGPGGSFMGAKYGPGKYGEGGTLDGVDPTRFYYAEQNGTLEFEVDWKSGRSRLVNVLARDNDPYFKIPGGYGDWGGYPEFAVYARGRRYLSDCFVNNPVMAPSRMTICVADGRGRMRPCASMGEARGFAELEREDLRGCWPDPQKRDRGFYIWSDRDDDGNIQPAELRIYPDDGYGLSLMPDMTATLSNYRGNAVRMRPKWGGGAAPGYSLDDAEIVCRDVFGSPSDGGDYTLVGDGGEAVMVKGAKPYSPYSISGAVDGEAVWSYPNLWPGLHASHSAPVPKAPGELVGPVRVMGPLMKPAGSEVKPVWFVSGNVGSMYVFTLDGLFVTSLFGDERSHRPFGAGDGERGTVMKGETIHGENFWTTATCAPDGRVYVTCRSRVLRVDGLDTLRPLGPFRLTVSAADIDKCIAYRVELERERRAREGGGVLKAPLLPDGAMAVDGVFGDWKGVQAVDIESQGAHAFFDSASRPFEVRGSVAVCGDRLHARWSTGRADMLSNTAENPMALFKTGGCLDLMLGTDLAADPRRNGPVPGDLRLLITRVDGKTRALVYRQKVRSPDPSRQVPFSSPSRTIPFDRVDDVSAEVRLAGDRDGDFEMSVPLAVLGLAHPRPGTRIKADIGVLRAADGHVNARHYWANKSTAITSDVPSEAELTPWLWGECEFVEGAR